MIKYLIKIANYCVYLSLIAFLFFDLTVNYWVQAFFETRVSYVIGGLFLWSLLLFLVNKGKDTLLTRKTLPIAAALVCFALWGLVRFAADSGDYAERLTIYTATFAGCLIAAAGVLRPNNFLNIRIMWGIYVFMLVLSVCALLSYRSYLEMMDVEAQFVLYTIPGAVDKNSFAYMLLFSFLIGVYLIHQTGSRFLRRLVYLPQIFLVGLLFNTGSRQALLMMLVFTIIYVKNIMPYLLRSRKMFARHFAFALLAVLLFSGFVLYSENTRVLLYRFGLGSDEGGEYGEIAQESDELRRQVSADSLEKFFSSPIIGTGTAANDDEQTDMFRAVEHNYLLQLASGEGVIGLALFVAIFFYTAILFRKKRGYRVEHGLDGSISVAVIQSMFAIVFLSLLFSPMKNLHWIVLIWVIIASQGPRVSAPHRLVFDRPRAAATGQTCPVCTE